MAAEVSEPCHKEMTKYQLRLSGSYWRVAGFTFAIETVSPRLKASRKANSPAGFCI
jgi:hypothetical protein